MQRPTGVYLVTALAFAAAPVFSQIGQQQPYPGGGQYPPGQYPSGGQYPPNSYPGGTGGGLPGGLSLPKIKFPRRKPKEEAGADSQKLNLAAVDGRLRKLGQKDLLLEIGKKGDILRFRLVAKTQFRRKSGEPMRDSLLNPGDRISVQVEPGDEETALLVTFVEAGGQSERAAADRPIDEAAIRAPRAEDLGKAKSVTVAGGANSTPAADGAEASGPEAAPAAAETRNLDAPDELILEAAREAALKFSASLPDFLAQQRTQRYFTTPGGGEWQALDVVTAEVAYSRGREEYRNVAIDGRPVTRAIERTGAWSTGEFGSILEGLMTGEAQAKFRRRPGLSKMGSRQAWVYDFTVTAAKSTWELVAPDQSTYQTAFAGSIWVDQETRRVTRIERRAQGLPAGFAVSRVETRLDYAYVRLDQVTHLLPAGGENVACAAGGACNRNVIEFAGYRKFGAESNIKF